MMMHNALHPWDYIDSMWQEKKEGVGDRGMYKLIISRNIKSVGDVVIEMKQLIILWMQSTNRKEIQKQVWLGGEGDPLEILPEIWAYLSHLLLTSEFSGISASRSPISLANGIIHHEPKTISKTINSVSSFDDIFDYYLQKL